MKILDTEFVKGFIRLCDDGFRQNWHERNGGNLSYRIKESEVESVRESFTNKNPWQPIGTCVKGLARRIFHGDRKRKVFP
jgi:rhamnulose-1-phosphate aldolase